jgi:hypothetical protein
MFRIFILHLFNSIEGIPGRTELGNTSVAVELKTGVPNTRRDSGISSGSSLYSARSV